MHQRSRKPAPSAASDVLVGDLAKPSPAQDELEWVSGEPMVPGYGPN